MCNGYLHKKLFVPIIWSFESDKAQMYSGTICVALMFFMYLFAVCRVCKFTHLVYQLLDLFAKNTTSLHFEQIQFSQLKINVTSLWLSN